MKAKKTLHHLAEALTGSVVFACVAADIVECLEVAKGRVGLPSNIQFEACVLAGMVDGFYLRMVMFSFREADTYDVIN